MVQQKERRPEFIAIVALGGWADQGIGLAVSGKLSNWNGE